MECLGVSLAEVVRLLVDYTPGQKAANELIARCEYPARCSRIT
jgi:hypothetical protein